MQVAYVRWRDAMALEANDTTPPKAELVELEEVGWLLHETEEAVLISMEAHPKEDGVAAGRWRLNIPRVNIVEMRVMDWGKAFPKRSVTIG